MFWNLALLLSLLRRLKGNEFNLFSEIPSPFLFPIYSILKYLYGFTRHLSYRRNQSKAHISSRLIIFAHFISLITQTVLLVRECSDAGIQEVQNPFDSTGMQISPEKCTIPLDNFEDGMPFDDDVDSLDGPCSKSPSKTK